MRLSPFKKHLLCVTWVEKEIIFSNKVVELWFYVHNVKDNILRHIPQIITETFKDTGSQQHSLLYTIKFASSGC